MIPRIQEFQDIVLKNHYDFQSKIKYSHHQWTSYFFVFFPKTFLWFNLINYFMLFHHVGSKVPSILMFLLIFQLQYLDLQILKDLNLLILNFGQVAFVLLISLLHQFFNHCKVFLHIF